MKELMVYADSMAYQFQLENSSTEEYFIFKNPDIELIIEALLTGDWVKCAILNDGTEGSTYDALAKSLVIFNDNGVKTTLSIRKKTEYELLLDAYNELLKETEGPKAEGETMEEEEGSF